MAKAKERPKSEAGTVYQIAPIKLIEVTFKLVGTAPLVTHAFGEKARKKMLDAQLAGSVSKKGKKRDPREPEVEFHEAYYKAAEGWYGIPCGAFRAALVSACKIVGFHMTKAKLALFVKPDGYDEKVGTPLVRIIGSDPEMVEHPVRLDSGTWSLVFRPMWRDWAFALTVQFDGDMFSIEDVSNLIRRAGIQVGICEGRNDSKMSCGMGWGSFDLAPGSELGIKRVLR